MWPPVVWNRRPLLLPSAVIGAAVAVLGVALCYTAPVAAETHAVLVAGSNFYYNYRHQTDICHSYQVLMEHGVPPENVIVMIYDDIASDPSNPFPGELFNKPTVAGTPGVDVYKGCVKDYTATDVTAGNFLQVLKGNATAMKGIGTGRVLSSGPDDHVFVYFSDHGGTGVVAFPTGPLLLAADLNVALQYMHDNEMYEKLTVYLEACESGSMFNGFLPADINVYVTTASNPDESSWGTYCPPDDMIDGKEIGSCLGDLYSVNWMEDADRSDSMSETLESQYETVKQLTTMSHVMQYGDMDWIADYVGEFEGNWTDPSDAYDTAPREFHAKRSRRRMPYRLARAGMRAEADRLSYRVTEDDTKPAHASAMTDSRDAKLHFLYWQYIRATPDAAHRWAQALQTEVQHRMTVDNLFGAFARRVGGDRRRAQAILTSHSGKPTDCGQCCNAMFERIRTNCPVLQRTTKNPHAYGMSESGWSDYALKYTRAIVNACTGVHLNPSNPLASQHHLRRAHAFAASPAEADAHMSAVESALRASCGANEMVADIYPDV